MGDLNNKAEQEKALREILSNYDRDTRNLYSEILKMYNEKGSILSDAKIREEIKDKVKEAVK